MQSSAPFKEKIHQANIKVHKQEAQYYDILHPEVSSRKEQKRILAKLTTVDKLVSDNKKNALDFGAGTGNLTGKLLQMGYTVVAVDISAEMCAILKKKYAQFVESKKLTVVNSPVEDLAFKEGKFDLVVGYSVLHHLPDYEAALRTLTGFVKKGGVIYIDHEASPFYWKTEPSMLGSIVKVIYFHSNPLFNSLYFQLIGLRIPSIDYTLSDFWHKKEHALNHEDVARVFREENFEFAKRTNYYQNSTWIPNPLFAIYRLLCKPEMSYWVAKK